MAGFSDKLVNLEMLGRGASGAVHLGVDVSTGQLVAIKSVSLLETGRRTMLRLELEALRNQRSQLLHPIKLNGNVNSSCIVDYYGTFFSDGENGEWGVGRGTWGKGQGVRGSRWLERAVASPKSTTAQPANTIPHRPNTAIRPPYHRPITRYHSPPPHHTNYPSHCPVRRSPTL